MKSLLIGFAVGLIVTIVAFALADGHIGAAAGGLVAALFAFIGTTTFHAHKDRWV